MKRHKLFKKPETLSGKIILATLFIIFIRILSNVPLPYINRDYLSMLFADSSIYGLFNTFSGGSFGNMTILALGVSPYITASIILQLLAVTFPKLEDIQKDDFGNNKKWKILNFIISLVFSIIQAVGICLTFGNRGLFTIYNIKTVIITSIILTIGTAITVGVGEFITKYCIGNGVSIILASNIIASLPGDVLTFHQAYVVDHKAWQIAIAVLILLIIVVFLIASTIILSGAQKEIPVVYATSARSGRSSYKHSYTIPIKLNTAGVMPIIFASTLFSVPMIFLNNKDGKVVEAIKHICSSTYWYKLDVWGIVGLVLDFILVIIFAYFYTSITLDLTKMSNNLRQSGASVPGLRPGTPTEEYIRSKIKRMPFIGATFLFILTQVPIIISHFTNIYSLSFGGTSVIIVVGVIVETTATIQSELMMKKYVNNPKRTIFGINYNELAIKR